MSQAHWLMGLGMGCVILSTLLRPGPKWNLTLRQIYEHYRAGGKRASLPIQLLGLIGVVLICVGIYHSIVD
jgi:hypothetical protein